MFKLLREEQVTSLTIAKIFDKPHRQILQSIDRVEDDNFKRENFIRNDIINASGRTCKSYDLSRIGYMFICMGLCGKKSSEWKMGLLKEFNRIEDELLLSTGRPEWKVAGKQWDLANDGETEDE